MTKKQPKLWFGTIPTLCDVCKKPLKKSFVDGSIRGGGWAILCTTCHNTYGAGLGIGKGQKYNLSTLEKIGG